jgi:hypothetical protein
MIGVAYCGALRYVWRLIARGYAMEYAISASRRYFDIWTPVDKPAVGGFQIRIDRRLNTSARDAYLKDRIKWQTEFARSLRA